MTLWIYEVVHNNDTLDIKAVHNKDTLHKSHKRGESPPCRESRPRTTRVPDKYAKRGFILPLGKPGLTFGPDAKVAVATFAWAWGPGPKSLWRLSHKSTI